jgi:hypothetical protein
MQALYEYNVSAHKNPKQIEKMLLNACEDIYRLYIKSLALFVPLTQIAEQIIDIKKTLFFAKEEDLHPNVKFIENQQYLIFNLYSLLFWIIPGLSVLL